MDPAPASRPLKEEPRPPAVKVHESCHKQIERLARFIQEEIPGEPSRLEGAVDTAIRLLRLVSLKQLRSGGAHEPSR